MSYELVSRALAYVSCMFTLSLFTTSMALAAVHVGLLNPSNGPSHGPPVLTAQVVKPKAVASGWVIHARKLAEAETARKI